MYVALYGSNGCYALNSLNGDDLFHKLERYGVELSWFQRHFSSKPPVDVRVAQSSIVGSILCNI